MKTIQLILSLFIAAAILPGCDGAETKAIPGNNETETETSVQTETETKTDKVESSDPAAASPASPATPMNSMKSDPNEILTHIDDYLISKATYPTPSTTDGGISNCSVVVKNTLPDAGFQSTMVEVNILLADGKEYRTEYYTLINLDPGTSKTIKIKDAKRGNSVFTHVVKIKSDELTKGESLVVGNHYEPGK